MGARPNSSGAKSRELGLGLETLAAFLCALAECGHSQWNAYPICHVIFNPMKCEYCLCGIWITANGIWIQPMKWEHCYIRWPWGILHFAFAVHFTVVQLRFCSSLLQFALMQFASEVRFCSLLLQFASAVRFCSSLLQLLNHKIITWHQINVL